MSADEFDKQAADDGLETLSRVDRSVPNQLSAVTGQSPRESGVMVVPDEWVEAGLNAMRDYWADVHARGAVRSDEEVRSILRAVLPLIEGRVREECAQEIEAMADKFLDAGRVFDTHRIAARLREGGRA